MLSAKGDPEDKVAEAAVTAASSWSRPSWSTSILLIPVIALLFVLTADAGPDWLRWTSRLFGSLALVLIVVLTLHPIVRSKMARSAAERRAGLDDLDRSLRLRRRSVLPGGLDGLPRDGLTGLVDASALAPVVDAAIREARRLESKVAVVTFDVDRLTDINGCHGFESGDELLRRIALRLTSLAPELVVRVDGDRFVMILANIESVEAVEIATAAALDRIGRAVHPRNRADVDIRPSASVGIALFPAHGESLDELLRRAEMALDEAKQQGGGRYRLFDESMIRSLRLRSEMERDLARAIERGQLCLHYQAQLDLSTATVSGFEALMRWSHPERGWVPPAMFIPIAESSGLIRPIGRWLLDQACRSCAAWQRAGFDLTMAINISAAQLREQNLPDLIAKGLGRHGLTARSIELELTESLFVDPAEIIMRRNIEEVASQGVHLAIDDFGTGYSSLAYLKRLPVEKIKIDKSFIAGIGKEDVDEALVRAIIGLARTFGKAVLAEGIETERQRMFLAKEGCDQGQGYLFSRPLPFEQCVDLAGRRKSRLPLVPRARRVAS